MSWKCIEFLGKINSDNIESYDFKSVKYPTAIPEMTYLEADRQQIIKTLDFRQLNNISQGKLENYITQNILEKVKRF